MYTDRGRSGLLICVHHCLPRGESTNSRLKPIFLDKAYFSHYAHIGISILFSSVRCCHFFLNLGLPMISWKDFHGPNAGYVLDLYERYRRDPQAVDAATRRFFQD